jgi:hypothetical protein
MSEEKLERIPERPMDHPEGDFSQCPMFFITLMQGLIKEKGWKPNSELIINPSTSEEDGETFLFLMYSTVSHS